MFVFSFVGFHEESVRSDNLGKSATTVKEVAPQFGQVPGLNDWSDSGCEMMTGKSPAIRSRRLASRCLRFLPVMKP